MNHSQIRNILQYFAVELNITSSFSNNDDNGSMYFWNSKCHAHLLAVMMTYFITPQFNWLQYGIHIRKSMRVVKRGLDSISADRQTCQLYTLCSSFSLSQQMSGGSNQRILSRSFVLAFSLSKQYYLQMHRNARKQCQILQGCDQRGSAHQDELSAYVATRAWCKSSAEKKRLYIRCSQLIINQQKRVMLTTWRTENIRHKLKARRESNESHQQHIKSAAIDTCQTSS